jgi:hypothetical protein
MFRWKSTNSKNYYLRRMSIYVKAKLLLNFKNKDRHVQSCNFHCAVLQLFHFLTVFERIYNAFNALNFTVILCGLTFYWFFQIKTVKISQVAALTMCNVFSFKEVKYMHRKNIVNLKAYESGSKKSCATFFGIFYFSFRRRSLFISLSLVRVLFFVQFHFLHAFKRCKASAKHEYNS